MTISRISMNKHLIHTMFSYSLHICERAVTDWSIRWACASKSKIILFAPILIVIVAHAAFISGDTFRRFFDKISIELLICSHWSYIYAETYKASVLGCVFCGILNVGVVEGHCYACVAKLAIIENIFVEIMIDGGPAKCCIDWQTILEHAFLFATLIKAIPARVPTNSFIYAFLIWITWFSDFLNLVA